MKNLWNVVSFMAVVNFLAILFFVGWLWRTDRLSLDRVRRARDMVAMTRAEEEKAAGEIAARDEQAQTEADAAARREDPPLPSASQIARTWLINDQSRQALRRLEDETAQHQAALDLRMRKLEEREAELRTRQERWTDSIRAAKERKIDEQFGKTVRLYEALAGKQAKRMLLELVDQDALDQAVAYIDAMGPRAAAKTLRELKTDLENELATELLERLRTFGLDAEPVETSGHANAGTDNQ